MSRTVKRDANGAPIDPSKMPPTNMSYSEWVGVLMEKTISGENTTQGIKHVNQDKNIFWPTWAQWASENVDKLSDSLFLFMASQNSWIFQFFPIEITQATTFIQQNMEVKQVLPHIGTRKVPNPKISARVSNRIGRAIYTIQGFSMDYSVMKTNDGRRAWDMLVDAVTANLWSFVIYNALNEMLYEPSYYRRENQLYPFQSEPRNVDELFDWEYAKLFILNKQPQAFHSIIADARQIMGQKQINCKGLIVAKDDIWYATGRDPTLTYYDTTGPISLRERSNAGKQTDIDGVTLYPIPLGSGFLHDDTFTQILSNVIQLGSFFRFPELTQNLRPDQYTSEKRSIRFASTSRNDFTKYTLLEVLSHSPEFFPLDSSLKGTDLMFHNDGDDGDSDDGMDSDSDFGDVDVNGGVSSDGAVRKRMEKRMRIALERNANPAGKLNLPLLYELINRAQDIFKRVLRTALRTNDGKNMDRINQFIRYNGTSNPKLKKEQLLYPIHVFGELAECSVKTKHLAHVNRTMHAAMFEGVTKEDVGKLEALVRLAKELNHTTSDSDIRRVSSIIDQTRVVVARADLNGRSDSTSTNGDDSLGCLMLAPSRCGGPPLNFAALRAELAPVDSVLIKPVGFGNMAGFLSLIDAEDTAGIDLFDEDVMRVVREGVPVFQDIVANMEMCCKGHISLSPEMIPLFHNSREMTDHTRKMIVAWYVLFDHFVTPAVITVSNAREATLQRQAQQQGDAAFDPSVRLATARSQFYTLTGDRRDYNATQLLAEANRIDENSTAGMAIMVETLIKTKSEDAIETLNTQTTREFSESQKAEYKVIGALGNTVATDITRVAGALVDLVTLVMDSRSSDAVKKSVLYGTIMVAQSALSAYGARLHEFVAQNLARVVLGGDTVEARDKAALRNEKNALFARSKLGPGAENFVDLDALLLSIDRTSIDTEGARRIEAMYKTTLADVKNYANEALTGNAQRAGGGTANVLTQLTFEGKNDIFAHVHLQSTPHAGSPLGVKHVFGGVSINDSDRDSRLFERTDSQMFGGSLFAALPFIHPGLPLLERSGDIAESLRARQDAARVSVPRGRENSRFRSGAKSNSDGKRSYDERVYTYQFRDELSRHPLMQRFPDLVAHMVANPLVQYHSKEATDFEARYMGTYAMQLPLAVAARCVLLTQITLQMLTTMFDHNIAIPLGAMALRPFETQRCFSAIAVAGEKIGTTHFSGFDNTIGFATLSQHFTVQAFLWMKAMVANNQNYLVIPAVRGGEFLGGKGHLFVNQDAKQPWQQLLPQIEAVSACNGEVLGDRSIIAVSDTYNNAIEAQDVHHLDLRNTWRRENFAGRLTASVRDFVELREDLSWAGAPLLNLLFNWDVVDTTPMESRSFAQMMRSFGRNFHLHEALAEHFDVAAGQGWAQNKPYHQWAKTDQMGCADVQQSHTAVVDAF